MIIQKIFKRPLLNDWAKTNLTPEEFVDFTNASTANSDLWSHFKEIGLFQNITLTETGFSNILQEHIEIPIGEKCVLSEGTALNELYVFPRMSYWLERYYQAVGSENVEIIT
jgi:hypothetical protein